jgi:hypothetical protein
MKRSDLIVSDVIGQCLVLQVFSNPKQLLLFSGMAYCTCLDCIKQVEQLGENMAEVQNTSFNQGLFILSCSCSQ